MITEAKFVVEPSEFIDLISETSLSYKHHAIFIRLSNECLEFFNPMTRSTLCYHTLTDARLPTIELYDDEPVLAALDTNATREFLEVGNHRKAHIYLQHSPGEPCASQIVVQQKYRATVSVELNPKYKLKKLVEKGPSNVRIKKVPKTKLNKLRDQFDSKGRWDPPDRDSEGRLRAETHVNELERIVGVIDHADEEERYPLKFRDDQLLLDFEDEKKGNSIKGYMPSRKIEGPDYQYHYGDNFGSILKWLSGPVELQILPNGNLALVKRERGKILRYLIEPNDKKS